MRQLTLGAVGLLWLAAAAPVRAQGTDDAILLHYRFQPGQELRYRLTLNADMPMTMSGITPPPGAKMPGKIPITMNGTYELVEKVKSVSPEGAATVSIGMDKMDLTTTMMGMNIVARLGPDGKLETLVNGKPATNPNAPARVLPNPLVEETIDPTGKVSGVNPDSLNAMNQLFGGQNISSLFNGLPGIGGLILPAQPIKPGDTWDTKFDLTMPLPVPGPAGPSPGISLPMSFAIRYKLLRVEDGRAVIETQMTASIPPGTKMMLSGIRGAPPGLSLSIQRMDESMTGTVRLPIEQGVVESGDYEAKMRVQMTIGLPPGTPGPRPGAAAGAAPSQAPNGLQHARKKPVTAARRPSTAAAPHATAAATSAKMGVDGTLKLKIERLPPPSPPGVAP
jgi:hypothetical protein